MEAAQVAAAPGSPPAQSSGDRALTHDERRTLAALGLPTFGLALAITVVSTYLPTVARQFTTSNTVIGVLIGGEGVGALILPVLMGAWSDRLRTRLGGRLPFVIAGVPVAAAALIAMGVVGSLWTLGLVVAVFFAGYFIAYEPYRALYPDLVADEVEGRAQSTQAVWRGAGTGLALIAGGLLLAADRAIPFVVAAAVLVAATVAFVHIAMRWDLRRVESASATTREVLVELRGMLLHDGALRGFFLANALWELSLAALKTFVILFLTRGLGFHLTSSSGIVGVTALVILVAAAVSGKLADRFGRRRVMLLALWVYGVGLLVPLFVTSKPLLAVAVPFVAFGGGVILSLPYALLIPLMPAKRHGALTGFYSMSRGLGIVLGPVLAGVAISALGGVLSSTHGYAAMWGVCALAIFASIPFLRQVPADR